MTPDTLGLALVIVMIVAGLVLRATGWWWRK